MMAAIGRMVQYANEEFRRAKNHQPGDPQGKCKMQISTMLSRNYTRRRIPTQPKIVGTLRSFLWFSAYESHYDRDVDGSRTQEYWQTSWSTML
jgi:hypothetical protein